MRTIIFDFDGTIADTTSLIVEIANRTLPEFGGKRLTDKDVQTLRGMTIPQGLRYLKLPTHKLPQMAIKGKQRLSHRIDELEPCPGMIDLLTQLHKKEFVLGIITSNSRPNVERFLERHKLTGIFDFIDTGASILRKGRRIKSSMRKHRLKSKDCLYVGDEIRDVQAAQVAGVDMAAVSWGVNTPEILSKHNPTYLLKHPQDLIKVIHA